MRTIADFIHLNAARHPEADALVDTAGRVSHAQLSRRALALAAVLAERGVRRGDAVGIMAGNGRFSAEAFLGVQAAGGVAVMLNWRWAAPELAFALNDVSARAVLVDRRFAGALAEARATGGLEQLECEIQEGPEIEELLLRAAALPVAVPGDPEDTAAILYTGGTTGTSKGVLLSHRALIANAVNEMLDCGVGATSDARGLVTTPMYHAAALACWFLSHYLSGATTVFMAQFDEALCAEIVASERITTLFLIPNMLRRLLKAGALDSVGFRDHVRGLHTGGASLRMPDKEAVRDLLPHAALYFRYGLTEAGPMVTRLRPPEVLDPAVDGSIGKEYLLAEAQIQDGDGSALPAGMIGELCVRGPSLMTGYHNRPEESAAALAGGWLHTGDLAERDERGFLYFRDRSKDMVKSGGENVYSAEVEQALYAHPAVMEAAVLGVASAEWDEEVRAVVALRPGHELDDAALAGFLRAQLAGYKLPKRVAFVAPEQMPINPSGKVVKAELAALVGWDRPADSP